jgi:hypothetical protein
MNPEPFASATFSVVLSWIFAAPAILSIAGACVMMLFEKADDDFPRWFVFWMLLCILVFSPLRYFFLQLLIATSYPFQSIRAFLSLLLLGLYVPIIFGILYGVGIALPLLLALWLPFRNLKAPMISTPRLIVASLLTPVSLTFGYVAFFWLLHFASFSVHWLKAPDVIGATNGPALATYSLALKHFLPLPVSDIYTEVMT